MKHITQAAICQLSNHGLFSIGGCIRLRLRYAVTRRAARSGFATSTQREYTTVFDLCGAGARREIDHDAPPQ
jgi:hypothetical protein